MQAFDYDEVLDMILAKDGRYHRDAYYFVREGLDFTQQKLTKAAGAKDCLLYTSPSPRDATLSRMPSSA